MWRNDASALSICILSIVFGYEITSGAGVLGNSWKQYCSFALRKNWNNVWAGVSKNWFTWLVIYINAIVFVFGLFRWYGTENKLFNFL